MQVWTDSSTAKAVTGRRGLGKLRHVELKWLWVQDAVKEGRIRMGKVNGEENVAEMDLILLCCPAIRRYLANQSGIAYVCCYDMNVAPILHLRYSWIAHASQQP